MPFVEDVLASVGSVFNTHCNRVVEGACIPPPYRVGEINRFGLIFFHS